MAYPRGQSKIVMNPGAKSLDAMFRVIATPSFFVALTKEQVKRLLAIEDIEGRLEYIYGNADDLWKEADFCELDDTWDPIHRVVNKSEPIESFEWDIGTLPGRYVILGDSQLIDGCTTNELDLISADLVEPIAKVLGAIDQDSFSEGYQVHCPRSWPNFGEQDCQRCWEKFVRLREFYTYHSKTGKSLVFAVEY